MRNKIYVIFKFFDTKKLYFKHEQVGIVGKRGEIIREPLGFFVPELVEAKKFKSKKLAEMIASAYEGAGVETIGEGERLK